MRLRRIAAHAALLLAGTAVALALAEGATRLLAPQTMSGSWFVYGPHGIMMNKASGSARDVLTPERTAHYEFNAWHQRGREEPDPAAVRTLVLGDSFTFGLGLALTDTYVDLLQQRFDSRSTAPRVQLLNASAAGWGTADQLAYLESFGERLNPSAVVVFVNAWDVVRSRELAIYQVTAGGQELSVADADAGRRALKRLLQDNATYDFLLEHSHLVQLLRRAAIIADSHASRSRLAARRDEATQMPDDVLFRLLMRRMAAWCAQRDVQFTVLTTGWPDIEYPWLAAAMQAEGIYYRAMDDRIAIVVQADYGHFSIKDDGHPNEDGARLIAQTAWPILEIRLEGLKARPMN